MIIYKVLFFRKGGFYEKETFLWVYLIFQRYARTTTIM